MHSTVVWVLVSVALEAVPGSLQWAGSFGQVTVMTRGQPVSVQAGQVLAADASVSTGPNSGVVLFQPPAACVQVGESAQLAVDAASDRPGLFTRQGEVRATVGPGGSLLLRTPLAETHVAASVVRTYVESDRVRFLVEQGRAEIQLTEIGAVPVPPEGVRRIAYDDQNPNSITLTTGQQVEIRVGAGFGPITEPTDEPWKIDPDVWLVNISQPRSQLAARDAIERRTQPQTETEFQVSEKPPFNTQIGTSTGINLTLGPTLASTGFSGAAISPSDANQETLAGMLTGPFSGLAQGTAFPGVIHLLTGETRYDFDSVQVTPADMFLGGGANPSPQYWSIGQGNLPTSQIATSLGTGTSIVPNALPIPQFSGHYLVQLDQFPIDDPLSEGSSGNPQLAVTGLLGQTPTGPTIQGATPLTDERARINPNATFALGEFAVRLSGENPQIAMRRSDQDRTIVKDPDGNDLNDQVTPNPDVTAFVEVPDNRFLPQNREVYVPVTGANALQNLPTYSNSDALRRAAFTVLTARELSGFAQRTGQTRFVVDGKIVDISGFRP